MSFFIKAYGFKGITKYFSLYRHYKKLPAKLLLVKANLYSLLKNFLNPVCLRIKE